MPKVNSRPSTSQEPLEDIGELVQVTEDPKPKATSSDWSDDLFVAYDETEEHLNVLYWGREGSGKTIDLATATQLGKVLFINAEGGLKKRALLANGVDTSNLVVFPRPGQELTYASFEQALFRVKSDLMDDPKSWFLVAIDSVTEIAAAFTEAVSDETFARNKAKNPNWTPGLNDQFFTDRGDYGVSTKMIRKLTRMLRDLPVHTAITALERRDVDEDTSKVAYGPAVGPALQTSLLGYVDVVLYTKAADEERPYFRAQTKKVGTARAKDRLGVIPTVLVDPTFPRLLAYNEGTLTEDTDPVQEALKQEPPKPAPKTARRTGGTRARATTKKSTEAAGEPSAEATGEDAGEASK
ncbi:RecA-like DNA recombinase [Microbacterium phage SBlackberry]|nr:RecA-like DNA recombinase [Microbacterium phage Cicada]UAW08791.1 RecA-like DNA recombinase [Microbacterium phage SBlackberry]